MKKLWLVGLLFLSLSASAQDAATYPDLLQRAGEISLTDSVYIQRAVGENGLIDSITAQKWFAPLFSSATSGKLKKRDFYIAGKITSNDFFDLLLLVEEKKKADSTSMQVMYLVTVKKDGGYIASFKAAISGQSKKVSYNISSWLYQGFKIVQDSRIITAQDSFEDQTEYTITGKGRFIAFAKN